MGVTMEENVRSDCEKRPQFPRNFPVERFPIPIDHTDEISHMNEINCWIKRIIIIISRSKIDYIYSYYIILIV